MLGLRGGHIWALESLSAFLLLHNVLLSVTTVSRYCTVCDIRFS